MESKNLLLLTDSYKVTHHKQYPPGTTKILSYFESRGGKFDHVIFFGLQYIVKKWLCQPITQAMIDEADAFFKAHFPYNDQVFNRQDWQYILEKHEGRLPLLIKAVPEGTRVPVKNLLFTVENTDPNVPWITNYFEGLLVQCWYPMTVCTNSFEQKKLIKNGMDLSCDDNSGLNSKLHDFGFRGSSTVESAGIGGCAHLINFIGTDNLASIITAKEFYNAGEMPGVSVVATEHSTMTSWGKDYETHATWHMLEQFKNGPLSVVSDSYDLWNFIDNVIGQAFFKDLIKTRKGTFIVRPDSGDPAGTLLATLDKLGHIFTFKLNSKGFKVLPDFIRVIQGDGISYETLEQIINALLDCKWSLDNVTFGSGGALLQKLDRDTQKCAYKCCLAIIHGKEVDVFKQPITDLGKQSKKGNLTLVEKLHDGSFETKKREDIDAEIETEVLQVVYRDGHLIQDLDFDSIKNRCSSASNFTSFVN